MSGDVFCCCCLPSDTYGRKGCDSNFHFFTELSVQTQAAGVGGTLNCCAFSLYPSGILSTTVSFLDIKEAILFVHGFLVCVGVCVHFHYFACMLCV